MINQLTKLFLGVALCALLLPAAPMKFYTIFEPEGAGGRTGSGTGYFEFDTDANTLLIDVTFSGLSGITTTAHIHCCTADPGTGTAGVAVTAPVLPGFPLGVSSGTYMNTLDLSLAGTYLGAFLNGSTPADPSGAEARLLQGILDGKAYFNIHSTTFTGGEIRGFLAPVPEPGTFLLAGLGILSLVGFRRLRLR
ncbi:MAG: CHRD domain-containing protein [Bryobacterales bacterium]|nr:CHRD domain-containing protein [Bryobacterales bacterium]